MIRDANPEPGSAATVSGSVKRRSRRAFGVGRISPNPAAVRGSGRVPSHAGGYVPSGRVGDAEAEGDEDGDGDEEGDGVDDGDEGAVLVEAGGAADGVPPHAVTVTARTAITASLRTSRA